MEKTRKRRGGFMKALYKAASKPKSSERSRSKVNPSPTEASGSFSSPQYWMSNINTNINMSSAQPIGLPNYLCDVYSVNGRIESTRDYDDENVDVKAASYISYVRERFKVDKADPDQRMYQEIRY